MNWNSQEFIWLDWAVMAVGILAVVWAVWRSIQKHRRMQQGADSEAYLFGKGEPGYIIGAAMFAAFIGCEHLVGLAGHKVQMHRCSMAHWKCQGG
jgi:SSS family solute:Na+ symporter